MPPMRPNQTATAHTCAVVASFCQKLRVLNSAPFLSVFSPLLSTCFLLVISESCSLKCEFIPTAAAMKEISRKKKERTLTTESESEHTEHLTAMMDHVRYGTPEICVPLVIMVVTVTVKFWEHNHCLRTFTQPLLHIILPVHPRPPLHRPNGVHTIFDAILNLFWCWLLYSWYVFYVGVVIPLPMRTCDRFEEIMMEKKRGPEIFVYIQPIYTYT